MSIRVLFLCPHGAAKSVTAAAFLTREADKLGLSVEPATAGTEPDPDIDPIVRERLEADDLPIAGPPRKVTGADFGAADVVVNIGCDNDVLPTSRPIQEWHIPDFSDDPHAAFAALENHATELAQQLAAPPH